MNIIEKIWGSTSEIFNINNVSINRLTISKNSQCSRHYHQYKYNMFFVESGSVMIHIWENDERISTTLTPGETLTIPPNIEHQFESISESIIYEIYYTILNSNDIIRK